MKNVLFVVYYFPPMGGSGVQRPLKFAKYLKKFEWNPIILCPEPGVYQIFDHSLEQELESLDLEIHRVKANTPFHKFSGVSKQTGLVTGMLAKVLRLISRTIYFPDNKKAWIEPAVQKGKELIDDKKIDLIFSTAPPFSNHIIAQQLNEISNIPYVLDYRDLFTGNHFEENESESRKSKKVTTESEWLRHSSGVVALDRFAGNKIQEALTSKTLNMEVISHGFDQEDFDSHRNASLDYKKGKINWLYSGLFYDANQPDVFLNGLKELFIKKPELREKTHLHFQGGLDSRIKKLISDLGFEDIVSDYGYLSHDISVANLLKADILWMISNFSKNLKQIKSGKLFEYIGTKKPILGLVHPGEASRLLNDYKGGFYAAPDNIYDVTNTVEEVYELWTKAKIPEASNEFTEMYERKSLTNKLSLFFDKVVENAQV